MKNRIVRILVFSLVMIPLLATTATANQPNQPPEAPTISGPTNGNVNVEYDFTFCAVDPDGDEVSYYVDWDDGDITGWTVPCNQSGEEITLSHIYTAPKTYTIKAKARDCPHEDEGPEGTHIFTATKSKHYIRTPFLNFLENHPNMFPILQLLLQRLGLQ